jgi:glycosyltransferase involved in cell wall biosynthesis
MTQSLPFRPVRSQPSELQSVTDLRLCAPIDFEKWASRYAAGAVSDRVPYGFDQLESADVRLSTTRIGAPRRSARGLVRRPWRYAGESDWAVTWDERSAVAAMQGGVRARRLASGLIWATDHIERSERVGEMRVLRKYLRRLDVIWCLSRPQVELASAWLRPRDRGGPHIDFVPFGINTERFAYLSYPEAKLVLSVGNDPDRDPQTTVNAMVAIRRADPAVTCVIQSQTLRSTPLGITLIPLATEDELQQLYRRASVVLIATKPNSHVSGMTVALEAQSVGRPIVMTHTPGANDYLSGENEAALPPGAAHGLAARTLKLLNDRAGSAEIGRRARQFVEHTRTTTTMMSCLRQLLALPTEEQSRPPTPESDA